MHYHIEIKKGMEVVVNIQTDRVFKRYMEGTVKCEVELSN